MGAFSDTVTEYMDEYGLAYAESTVKARRREMMQICRQVESLLSEGRISTEDPADLTLQDIKVIAASVRSWDISVNTRTHVLGRLNMICKFSGNMVVEHAKVRYPTLFPAKQETRLGVLRAADYERILEFASGPDHDFRQLRSCVSVVLPLATGIRPQETRMVRDEDVDLESLMLHVEHVKGEGSYGMPRNVPIDPRAAPILGRYLDAFRASGRNGYIFQNSRGEPVKGNTQREWRRYVVESTGIDLDHRILRRTWGQMMEDNGVGEEYVSVLMGHASTATTARYYARTSERKAIEEVRKTWITEETR